MKKILAIIAIVAMLPLQAFGAFTVPQGGTGVGTLTGIVKGNGTANFSAITTSSGIFSVISDETGSGAMVGATLPTFVGALTGNGATSSGFIRYLEDTDFGSNYWQLSGPTSIGSNVTCQIDGSGFIPDSCVGDGTDGVGGDASYPIDLTNGSQVTGSWTGSDNGFTYWNGSNLEKLPTDTFYTDGTNIYINHDMWFEKNPSNGTFRFDVAPVPSGQNITGIIGDLFSGSSASATFVFYDQNAVTPSAGNCAQWVSQYLIGDSGSPCGAGGSGDIESVGDVTSGAAFDGSAGTTLTFNDASGDKTLALDTTNDRFTLNAPLQLSNQATGAALIRGLEDSDNGTNFIAFQWPAAITSDVTCTLENDGNPIPDSCVGDGTDGGSTTAWNDIGDATGDGTIDLGAHETDFTSSIDASGESIWTITNSDADAANDNSFIDLKHNDGGDANAFYFRAIGDNDGTPTTDYSFSQTAATFRVPLLPATSNTYALGNSSLYWSDLFLGDGAVIDINSDVTLTHSADALTMVGGELRAKENFAVGNQATSSGILKILEDTDAGSNFASFQVPSLAANTAYVLPADDGDSGEQLQTDGSGNLTWEAAGSGSGAPTDADYLVGTANGSLSAEIVVGTSPGGELGGTWGSPTLDDSVTTTGWVMGTFSGTTLTAGTVNIDLLDGVGAVDMDYGSADITDHTFTTDGTGTAEIVLPAGAIDSTEILNGTLLPDDLDVDADTPGDEECLTYESTGTDFEWETCGAGSGDITSVGDVASGAAFDGTQGTILTFNDADGDKTIEYDNTNNQFEVNANWLPAANDGAALGSASQSFADLFLASGAVTNWNNGDMTLTHSSNALRFGGGIVSFSDAAPVSVTGTERVMFEDADGNNSDWSFRVGGEGFGTISFAANDNTLASPQLKDEFDNLGEVTFYGHDGTNYEKAAYIRALAGEGTTGNNDMPGTIVFATTPDGSVTPSQNVKITPAGALLGNGGADNVFYDCIELGLDPYSNITTGTSKDSIVMPYAMTVTHVYASLTTGPTGSVATFDVNEGGTSIISTKITIDASETSSQTAATPAVISDSAVAKGSILSYDQDGVGSTTPGNGAHLQVCGNINY